MPFVGCWVVAVTPDQKLYKRGLNGGQVEPYPNRAQADEEARFLRNLAEHKDDKLYILVLSSNGEIRLDEFEEPIEWTTFADWSTAIYKGRKVVAYSTLTDYEFTLDGQSPYIGYETMEEAQRVAEKTLRELAGE